MDVGTLIACGIGPTQARLFCDPVSETLDRYEINTPARVAAFLAQTWYESSSFVHTEENLYYTTPERIRAMWPSHVTSLANAAVLCRDPKSLANAVYSNRMGNAGPESFDGWNFRGRGLIQVTGRTNYKVAGDAIGVDYVSSPDLVALPLDATRTAGWFWASIHANELADASQFDAITRRVNGGTAGAAERMDQFTANMRVLQ